MACGMTPDMIQMVMNMQDEKEKKEEKEKMEKKTKISEAVVTDKRVEENKGSDWTRTYRTWQDYQDPEEQALAEQEERTKMEHAAQKTSCNHDHSAVCI